MPALGGVGAHECCVDVGVRVEVALAKGETASSSVLRSRRPGRSKLSAWGFPFSLNAVSRSAGESEERM